jgi:hypothetical protein
VIARSTLGSEDSSTESIEFSVFSGDNLTVPRLIKVDSSIGGAIDSGHSGGFVKGQGKLRRPDWWLLAVNEGE